MNRNKLMMLNAVVTLLTTVSNTIFGMIEVSLFISRYGSDINGLLQTGNQVLGYLTLIEAGLCAAFLFHMYKPMADNDKEKLSALYGGFRKGMSSVVNKMLLAAAAVSLIYPLLIKGRMEQYGETFAIFFLLSVKAILPYKITMVPKYMIVLKEQKYKAELLTGVSKTVTYIIEVLIMLFFDWPVYALLVACILISLLTGLLFRFEMNRLYKNLLVETDAVDLSPRKMSADILAHNISRIVFSGTPNIILSILGDLNAVTIYSSYNMVVGQIGQLAHCFLDGASASMGIKIAKKDDNAYGVYREMLIGTLWLGCVVSAVFIVMINDFVKLWIGPEFMVSGLDVILFGVLMFCGMLLPCIQLARNACGLYKESRNFTIAQAVLNLVVTLLLVPLLGITGSLIGTTVARVIITVPFNYHLVEKKVFFQEKIRWHELCLTVGIMFLTATLSSALLRMIDFQGLNSILTFVIKAVLSTVVVGGISTLYFWRVHKEFTHFLTRILGVFKRKSKNA